jgi:PTS system mannose-specific IIC component
LLVIIVAFLAGMEGILDEWEFHQPLVACTLIGLVTGHPMEGIILGGSAADDCPRLGQHRRCRRS